MQHLEELSRSLMSEGWLQFQSIHALVYLPVDDLPVCVYHMVARGLILKMQVEQKRMLMPLCWHLFFHTPGKDKEVNGKRTRLIYLQIHAIGGWSEGKIASLGLIHHTHIVITVIFKVTAIPTLTLTHRFIFMMDTQLLWEHSLHLLMFPFISHPLSPLFSTLAIMYTTAAAPVLIIYSYYYYLLLLLYDMMKSRCSFWRRGESKGL